MWWETMNMRWSNRYPQLCYILSNILQIIIIMFTSCPKSFTLRGFSSWRDPRMSPTYTKIFLNYLLLLNFLRTSFNHFILFLFFNEYSNIQTSHKTTIFYFFILYFWENKSMHKLPIWIYLFHAMFIFLNNFGLFRNLC